MTYGFNWFYSIVFKSECLCVFYYMKNYVNTINQSEIPNLL